MSDKFELPSGLPKGPWKILEDHIYDHWRSGFVVCDSRGGGIAAIYRREPGAEVVTRAIASIPDMVEEIGRLQRALNVLKGDCAECFAQNESLHALNAELREALADIMRVIATDDLVPESVSYMKQARAILAKSQEAAP